LASLKEEANSTMKKMGSLSDGINLTSDPRLDGGVSIKTLLSHYREVKKETLFDDDSSRASESEKVRGSGEDQPMIHRKKPPPPPPPRRKASIDSANSGNGLSEFTII
jgi:hypothetical protein